MKVGDKEFFYRQIYRDKVEEEIGAYDIFFQLEANKINPELTTKTPDEIYLYFNSKEGYNTRRKIAELWSTLLKEDDKSFVDKIRKLKKEAIKKK